MFTVTLLTEAAEPPAVPSDVLSTIAVVVIIMLLGFALKGVTPVVATLASLVRTLFSALCVVVLLGLAVIVLIAGLVMSAIGH